MEDYVATWSSSTDKAAVLILVNDARILRDIPIITMLQLNRKMSKLRNAIPKAIRKRASGSGGSNSGVKRENPQLAPVDMASQGAPDVISSSMMRHLSPEFWSGCYAKVIEEEKKKLEGDQHTEDEEDDYDEITFDENIFTEEEDPKLRIRRVALPTMVLKAMTSICVLSEFPRARPSASGPTGQIFAGILGTNLGRRWQMRWLPRIVRR